MIGRGQRGDAFGFAFAPRARNGLGRMKSAYELAMERLEKSAPSVALTDEQKAAAEVAKAKAADVSKKEAELLAKSQDVVASRYIQEQKAKGVFVKPTPIAVAPPAPAAVPAAAAPAKK